MYRVLLVDDEPLILSGIRFIIDWTKNECELIGTARNGRQALEMIESLHPNIVIADINMPVMGGLELLSQSGKEFPDTVFIMLTNYQEFDLVREALRLHACDYLIKTQMDPQLLKESLTIAKKESDRRKSFSRLDLVQSAKSIDQTDLLKGAACRMLFHGTLTADTANILKDARIPEGYGVIKLWFSHCDNVKDGETRSLLMWASEMIDELLQNCFTNHLLIEREWQYLLVLYWGNTKHESEKKQKIFEQKLTSISSKIIGATPIILYTNLFSGEKSYSLCRKELDSVSQYYYISGKKIIYAKDVPQVQYHQLPLSGISNRLRNEMNNRNINGCETVLDRVIGQIGGTLHERSQATWVCSELYFSACQALENNIKEDSYFYNSSIGHTEIENLETRGSVVFWLQRFRNEILSTIQPLSTGKTDILDEVKQYILDNVEKRISLQDAANHVCISSAYLSSLFKKEFDQTFVDFVNQTKIERACQLILAGKHRINEIAYQLAFENAYYFSKVFRRHMGASPTEWQKKYKR